MSFNNKSEFPDEKLIIVDPETGDMVKLHFCESGHGYAIRTFSGDIFNPKLVPPYVKNI